MLKNTKVTFLTFVLGFSFACNAISKTELNLTVVDNQNNSIPDVKVWGACNSKNFENKTDDFGKFSVSSSCVLDEEFYLNAVKDGYGEYHEKFWFYEFNQLKDKKIVLLKK